MVGADGVSRGPAVPTWRASETAWRPSSSSLTAVHHRRRRWPVGDVQQRGVRDLARPDRRRPADADLGRVHRLPRRWQPLRRRRLAARAVPRPGRGRHRNDADPSCDWTAPKSSRSTPPRSVTVTARSSRRVDLQRRDRPHPGRGEPRFLADATTVLASSLDYEQTIRSVAEMAVPTFADWYSSRSRGTGQLARTAGHCPRRSSQGGARPRDAGTLSARSTRPRVRTPCGPDSRNSWKTSAVATAGSRPGAPKDRRGPPAAVIHRGADGRPTARRPGSSPSSPRSPAASTRPMTSTWPRAWLRVPRRLIQNAQLFRDVERYKRILDATLDAVVMFDPETLALVHHVLEARSAALAMTANAPHDVAVGPDRRSSTARRWRPSWKPLVGGRLRSRTVTINVHQRNRHAGCRWGRCSSPARTACRAEPGRIVAIARDISDRHRSPGAAPATGRDQARPGSGAERNHPGDGRGHVVGHDPDGTVVLANPAAEDLFPQINRHQGSTGSSAGSTIRTAWRRRSARTAARSVAAAGHRGAGKSKVSTYPVSSGSDGSRGAGGAIVLIRDITEARQKQAVRDTFIGVLSHELRTPVTTIYAGSRSWPGPPARSPTTSDEPSSRTSMSKPKRLHTDSSRTSSP